MDHPEPRYGAPARLLHWLTVALVAIQIPAGIAMTGEGFERATVDLLFILHKGTGVVLLGVILLRVLWRLTHAPPPLPARVPAPERRLAGVGHALLYVLLVLMPVSGYVRTVGDGFPIELLNALGVPPLLPSMPEIARNASIVHRFTAYALAGLIAVHVMEVLRHQWVERTDLLGRMWPPLGRRRRPAPKTPEREPAAV